MKSPASFVLRVALESNVEPGLILLYATDQPIRDSASELIGEALRSIAFEDLKEAVRLLNLADRLR